MPKKPITSEEMAAIAEENAATKKGRPWQKTLKLIKNQPKSMFPNKIHGTAEEMPPAELPGVWGGSNENDNLSNLFANNPATAAAAPNVLNLAAEKAAKRPRPAIRNFSMGRGSGLNYLTNSISPSTVKNLSNMTGAKPETVANAMNAGSAGSNAALVAAAATGSNKKRTRNARNNPNNTRKVAAGKPARKAVSKKPVAATVPIAAVGASVSLNTNKQLKADDIIAAITADVSSPVIIGRKWAEQKSNFSGLTIEHPLRVYVSLGLEKIANSIPDLPKNILSKRVLLGIVNELKNKPKII